MKTKNLDTKAAVADTRWATYAAAAAATTIAFSHSLEAEIHYSGILKEHFPRDQNKVGTFPLDEAHHFGLQHSHYGFVGFSMNAGSVRAPFSGDYRYVSKLHFGQNISEASRLGFTPLQGTFLTMANSFSAGAFWNDRGKGYIGFRFTSDRGVQYGWARVWIAGDEKHGFTLLDYAYGDAGETIRAGQKSSDKPLPDEGSLGWLAAGAVGLLAWRKSRSRAAH